ncbi:hypothetical protein DFH09DRAFT_1435861 [Mycena vulgaris]|nr:hypothetical protein DFH09DRAFT_1435861 [Mycena vulgaris]
MSISTVNQWQCLGLLSFAPHASSPSDSPPITIATSYAYDELSQLMHPDLHLRNLAKLPPRPRKIAQAACAPNHSLRELKRLNDLLDEALQADVNLPGSIASDLIPAIFHLLNPQFIPTAAELDSPTHITELTIQKIARLFTNMCTMAFPPHLGPGLFPRVWVVVNFLDTYSDHLPFATTEDNILCSCFLFFTGYLHCETGGAAYMSREPGFYHLIGRSFPWVFNPPFPSMKETLVGNICGFLQHLTSDGDPSLFEEFVAGAGGSAYFAIHLVRYFSSVLEPCKTLSVMEKSFLRTAIMLVACVERRNPGDPASVVIGQISPALRENGIIVIFDEVAARYWIPCAIEHDLLRAIISASQLPAGENLHRLQFLIKHMSAGMVYYRVPVAFAAALPTLMALTSSTAFRSTDIYPWWHDLTRVMEQRLWVMRAMQTEESLTFRWCDSLECAHPADRTALQRCSGCLSKYYCSRECQSIDWRAGGHRQECSILGEFTQSSRHRLPVRERRYLRALVEHDYRAAEPQIIAQNHDPTRTFTLFDYNEGPVRMTVLPLDADTVYGNSEVWAHSVVRVQRGAGRLTLRVVKCAGMAELCMLVPHRRSAWGAVDPAELHRPEWDVSERLG